MPMWQFAAELNLTRGLDSWGLRRLSDYNFGLDGSFEVR